MVALFSPDGGMAATDRADYANLNIVDELKRLPGIGDVSVFGNAQSAMRIWLDPEKMGLMGITIKDVENAIEAQNAQRSAGRVGTAPTVSEQQLYYTITTVSYTHLVLASASVAFALRVFAAADFSLASKGAGSIW